MLDLEYYFSLCGDKGQTFLKFFHNKNFKSLSGLIYFIETLDTSKIDWIGSENIKKRLLEDKQTVAEMLKPHRMSLLDKIKIIEESLEINNSTFPEFEFKEGSTIHGGTCPNCGHKELYVTKNNKARIKCSRRDNCQLSMSAYKYLREFKNQSQKEALNELAKLANVDLDKIVENHEKHVYSANESISIHSALTVTKKETPKEEIKKPTIEYITFDQTKSYKVVDYKKLLSKYADMTESQQFMMIVTSIHRFSQETKQWGKENYYKSRGISAKLEPLLLEKVKMINKDVGYIHGSDIPSLVRQLTNEFPINDLVKFGVINDMNHRYPYGFKHATDGGFCVIPNFDLYTNMCTGLKFRNTKLKSWQNKSMKEPELSYGRIANPLPYALTREALLDDEVIFRFFEGSVDMFSLPYPRFGKYCDIAIPGVEGLNIQLLGLFKGRKVILIFDQDEPGQVGVFGGIKLSFNTLSKSFAKDSTELIEYQAYLQNLNIEFNLNEKEGRVIVNPKTKTFVNNQTGQKQANEFTSLLQSKNVQFTQTTQKGLKELLQEAGAFPEVKNWDIKLGSDVNEVLKSKNIKKII